MAERRRPRLSGLYRLGVAERLARLREGGVLDGRDHALLAAGECLLDVERAERMIENVIGVAGLPLAVAPNFVVNGRERVVPLAVEEPSIVAALSAAARLARSGGGFTVESEESLATGQVQLVDIGDPAAARRAIAGMETELVERAAELMPGMKRRGGGLRAVELRERELPGGDPMLVVHLLVDTRDAMGANLVNTLCEALAPALAERAGGRAHLRILSNLTDRSLYTARVRYPLETLEAVAEGAELRDGIVLANDFALVDSHRAATHNKGVMNGVDAVAVATGNDWRALEAAAHAWAARDGRYRALTRWRAAADGALEGELTLPVKVGTVGGTLASNPGAGLALRLLGVERAGELAEVLAAVGLAQNFSALRALAGEGIQRGHMSLHARSVASAAGATAAELGRVVTALIEDGEIKVWKAREILAVLRASPAGASSAGEAPGDAAAAGGSGMAERRETETTGSRYVVSAGASAARGAQDTPAEGPGLDRADGFGSGAGKAILLGEHAVVYGRRALALPLPYATEARIFEGGDGIRVTLGADGPERPLAALEPSLAAPLGLLLERLSLADRAMRIRLDSALPAGVGLGGSAAFAVALVRALDTAFDCGLDDAGVDALAFACEGLAHGTPSGVDNAVATYARPLVFRRGDPPRLEPVKIGAECRLVIGLGAGAGATSAMVAGVRARRERRPEVYERLFDQIDALVTLGVEALAAGDLETLGEAMNVCQGLLNAMGVSTPELERMVGIARDAGAAGAKLTGAGGGGAMLALCPAEADRVAAALERHGYRAYGVELAKSARVAGPTAEETTGGAG